MGKSLSFLLKVVKQQVDADKEVASLVETMSATIKVVNVLDCFSDKVLPLKDSIIAFAKQCAECASFVRQYTTPGFLGKANIQICECILTVNVHV